MVQTYTEENLGQEMMNKIVTWCVKRNMEIMCFAIRDIKSLG